MQNVRGLHIQDESVRRCKVQDYYTICLLYITKFVSLFRFFLLLLCYYFSYPLLYAEFRLWVEVPRIPFSISFSLSPAPLVTKAVNEECPL